MSREERNDAKDGGDKDFGTDSRVLKKRKREKRVQNQNNSTEDDLGLLFRDGITGKFPRFANEITLQDAENSFLSRIYHKGQLVSCVVLQVDNDRKEIAVKKIWLSLRLSLLHKAVTLDAIQEGMTKELKGISIDLLVPGMMVNACVLSTLENGVLLSFLTYFTGTVDLFNLNKTFPSSKWKNEYAKNIKFNARILFIDPSTRAVGLTLSPQLVSNKAPASLVDIGDIFEQCKVVRIDKGSGLLLEVPTVPVPTPTYVNVTDVADKEVKLDKSFNEGSSVHVRIHGYRHLEGIATGTLKASSAFEGQFFFTHSDVKPGMVVKAKVIAVAIVQLASGVKALCPLRHMSEFEIAKPKKKFKVGIDLDSKGPRLRWNDGFEICSVIEGKVHEIKHFGVVISFKMYFITVAETTVEKNSVVRAAVLDISKIDSLVDLSLKPEFLDRTNEEGSSSKTLKKVLSLPAYNYSIGYASLTDYNTQRFLLEQFSYGQSVFATVMALPGPTTGGRLLLLLKSLSDGMESSSSKHAKKSSHDVGSLAQAEARYKQRGNNRRKKSQSSTQSQSQSSTQSQSQSQSSTSSQPTSLSEPTSTHSSPRLSLRLPPPPPEIWLLLLQWAPSRGVRKAYLGMHSVIPRRPRDRSQAGGLGMKAFTEWMSEKNELCTRLHNCWIDMVYGKKKDDNFSLWLHAWREHGSFSGLRIWDFFEKVCDLYDRIRDKVKDHITPSVEPQSLEAFRTRISTAINANIRISGYRSIFDPVAPDVNTQDVYLYELGFEINIHTLEFVNAQDSYVGDLGRDDNGGEGPPSNIVVRPGNNPLQRGALPPYVQ